MAEPLDRGRLEDRIAELEETVEALVRQAPLQRSSIQDDDGKEIVRLGVLEPGNEHGLEIFDPVTGESVMQIGKLGGTLGNGIQIFSPDRTSHVFLVTDALGFSQPWQQLPMGTPSTDLRDLTTSGSFVEAFLVDFASTANEISFNLAVSPPSSGEMEVRSTITGVGGTGETILATRSYTAGAQDLWEFPDAIPDEHIGNNHRLRVKHRKVSGTGSSSVGIVTHPVNRA